MKKIPLYIIEEHNEAFLIWNYAVHNNIIKPFGNTLLHVDHHPDMEYGGYRTPIKKIGTGIENIKKFTYEDLGIADFIYPAIYMGIFNQLFFVKDTTNVLSKEEQRCIYSVDGIGKNLILTTVNQMFRLKLKNEKYNEDCFGFFGYREGGLENLELKQPFVLDIDIDYFCADDSLKTTDEKLIEITKDAYNDINNNLYHPFRILPRKLLDYIEKDGKYYIKYEEQCESGKELSEDVILRKMKKFEEYLLSLNRKPTLIDICRSRYSGYTNNNRWKFIEDELLKVINKIYDVDIKGVWDV